MQSSILILLYYVYGWDMYIWPQFVDSSAHISSLFLIFSGIQMFCQPYLLIAGVCIAHDEKEFLPNPVRLFFFFAHLYKFR